MSDPEESHRLTTSTSTSESPATKTTIASAPWTASSSHVDDAIRLNRKFLCGTLAFGLGCLLASCSSFFLLLYKMRSNKLFHQVPYFSLYACAT